MKEDSEDENENCNPRLELDIIKDCDQKIGRVNFTVSVPAGSRYHFSEHLTASLAWSLPSHSCIPAVLKVDRFSAVSVLFLFISSSCPETKQGRAVPAS